MKRKKPESFGGLCLGVLLPLLAAQAWAQSEGEGGAASSNRPRLLIEPRLSVTETLTDNLKLRTHDKDVALISTIAPGIRISATGGRVRGSLDYALNGLLYSKSNEPSRVQNQLSARGSADLIDNWFVLDARASISQQPRSAFGTGSIDPTLPNSNVSELYTLGLSPALRGQLRGVASYELRADINESRAKDATNGDLSSRGLSLQLGGLSAQSLFGWSAFLSNQRWRPGGGRYTESSMVTGTLLFRPDPEWNFGLTLGKERNSFTTLSQESGNTYGASANWLPTPRTKAAADWQHHDYGDSHTLSLEHRMARSVWRVSDTQIANVAGPQGNAGAMTNYDLFFSLFASREPDLRKRDLLVRQFLGLLGLNPNAIAIGGFMNSTASLMRRQELSFALEGQRSTVTFLLSRTKSNKIDPTAGGNDDFAQTNRLDLRSFSVNIAYRLTPISSASVLLTQQKNQGELDSQRTDLKSLIANWNARLGPYNNLTVGVRHNRFNSPTQPYRENAVLATYTQQF
ncbi:TIGR03016 family PEP-CTERM system-associated outer membrane protein [Roseateles sp. DAIF2]|uniref:TIGR03016 family PEP-CTERM system-associated outer membrane protein n=1 Tax=Roseateles sp. DAIF2 TaxID=2714952 RepID=UPI0018A32497|nr:TIGR03016 family PEP-CTERM system-associated outer membrane protein [Roseateles sp. DAIF2]QPF73688.1 TIGR03016 family PEP-CTERM system-associated outer membrane protein [Roseateles sp. DAIF2]